MYGNRKVVTGRPRCSLAGPITSRRFTSLSNHDKKNSIVGALVEIG